MVQQKGPPSLPQVKADVIEIRLEIDAMETRVCRLLRGSLRSGRNRHRRVAPTSPLSSPMKRNHELIASNIRVDNELDGAEKGRLMVERRGSSVAVDALVVSSL